MSGPLSAPRRSAALRLLPAAASGAVSLGLLLALPVVGAAAPGLGSLPRPGDAAWWTVAPVLVAQAVALAGVAGSPLRSSRAWRPCRCSRPG